MSFQIFLELDNLYYLETSLQVKSETDTLDVLDSILESISSTSNIAFKRHDIISNLPGFKCKEGMPNTVLPILQRNIVNSANVSTNPKFTEDEDKGIAEIMMLQQRTVLQVILFYKLCYYIFFDFKYF